MMGKSKCTAAVAALLSVAAQAGHCDGDAVRLYNWTNFLDPAVVLSFESENGVAVVQDSYADADEAEARLAAGGTGYDLAIVALDTVGRLMAANALRPFELNRPGQLSGPNEDLLQAQLDIVPEAAGYVVPYIWGTTGIVYDQDAVAARIPDAPTDSWALIFDPENARRLQDCGISIVDSNEEIVAAVLAYLGRDPQSKTPQDMEAAMQVLDAISPYVSWFDTAQYDKLAEGEACLAVTWSSDGLGVLADGSSQNYSYVLPKEGTNIWVDVFVVPSDTAQTDRGYQLLDHMLRPEAMALSAHNNYGIVTDTDIRARIGSVLFDHPALSLPEDVRENLYVVAPRDGPAKRELDRRWRMMKLNLDLGNASPTPTESRDGAGPVIGDTNGAHRDH